MADTDVLTQQIKLIRDLRNRKTELSAPVKEVSEQLDAAEGQMIVLLNEAGLKTLKTEFGKATVVHKSSVKIPATPEDMLKFLDYVKQHDPDLYNSKVCMKSTDVNQYFELKLEEARELGKDDVEIPGIGGLSFREDLSFTKA